MAKVKNIKHFYSKVVIEAYRDLKEASEPKGINRYEGRQIIEVRVEKELAIATAMINALEMRVKRGLVKEYALKRSVSANEYGLYTEYRGNPDRLREDLQKFATLMNAKCPDSIVGWEVSNVLHPDKINWIDLGSDAGVGKLIYESVQEGNSKSVVATIQSLTDDELAFIEFDIDSLSAEDRESFARAISDRLYTCTKKQRILKQSKNEGRVSKMAETIAACDRWLKVLDKDCQIESEN